MFRGRIVERGRTYRFRGRRDDGATLGVAPSSNLISGLDHAGLRGLLELGARSYLDGLGCGHMEGLAGLRVSTHACRSVDLREFDVAGDVDFAALADLFTYEV